MGMLIPFIGEVLKNNSLLTGPRWFDTAAMSFEAVFILVSIMVMLMSYKAYKLTGAKRYFFFSSAFGFFTLSFAARLVTGISRLYGACDTVSQVVLPTMQSQTFFHFSRLLYVFFVLLAFTIILLCSMRVYKRRLVAFFMALLFILALATHKSVGTFYLLALVFLFFISVQYYTNFKKTKILSSGMTFFAFLLMFVQYLFLVLVVVSPIFYIGAYLMQLVAFLILLAIMIRVLFK